MEVGKKSILNGFIGGNNSTQFVIPIYQRNYVWKRENIMQLLSDIESMIPYVDDSSKYHFFGTIVYIDTLHKGSFSEWTIIDGQQRLTTIFLLLQALRQIYTDHSKVIEKKYLLNDEDIINSKDEYDRYRLKPLVTDDNMYLKISETNLDNLTAEEEDSNIYRMYSIIKKHLLSWKDKYDYETIINAIDKFRIVWIQLDKNEDPQQVFESINSTGVNLTAADLIRNFILMNKDDETQTHVYKNYWEKIEFTHVGTDNLKEFFRFYTAIKKKDRVSDKDVYEIFKNQYISLCGEGFQNEEETLKEILHYSENYGYITNDSSPIKSIVNSEKINSALIDYRNLESSMPTIVVMEVIKMFREGIVSDDDAAKTIRLMTNYILRRSICGEESRFISGSFGNILGRILKYYKKSGNFYESAVRAVVNDNRMTGRYMPNDTTLKEQFQKGNLYNRFGTGFVLKKIENSESRIPYNQLNIEHIMPQTKTKYWDSKINQGSNYEEIVNTIGNLTLVDSKDNSSMSNKDFESKKAILSQSKHIKMNELILDKKDWNEDEILKRADLLSDKFIEMYPFPDIPKDLPLILNINEDDEEIFKKAKKGTPTEVMIGNEDTTFNVVLWDEAFKKILKYLYKLDSEKFLSSYEILKGLTSSYEVDDNKEIDVNIEPMTSFKAIQTTIKRMNIETPIRIIYSTDQISNTHNNQSLFNDEDLSN